jgi:ABC-type multidrug transport system fused ATPase/permease subunit
VNNSSVLFKNICSEVSLFTSYIVTPVLVIGSEVIVLTGLFVFLFIMYPVATLILAVAAGVGMVTIDLLLKKRIRRYAVDRNIYSEVFFKYALESLNAVKEIQMFNVSGFFSERFKIAVRRYYNSYIKANVIGGLPRCFLETTLFCVVLIVMIVSVKTSENYQHIVPMMTVICLVAMRLMPSISKIMLHISSFHYAFNSFDTIHAIMSDYCRKPKVAPSAVLAPLDNGACIRIERVSFRYEGTTRDLFTDLSLDIPLSKIVAIVGETGSGKSTLLDIIIGLLHPQAGSVVYRGIILSTETIAAYRALIGYVPQSIYLIDDTIEANIAFGVRTEHIDGSRIRTAVSVAQLDDFISGLQDGFKTVVGEKGVRISGGQRQRIGIARALYNNPEILVLDEATSALDMRTEMNLYRAVKELRKTVILVTHRLSTIENADLIFVLDKGAIVSQGSYAQVKQTLDRFKTIDRKKQEA